MDQPQSASKDSGELGERLQRSASSLKRSAAALDEESDRRTAFAADRTLLAAERTYAAWVRTGIAALASGVGAHAVLADALPMWLVRITASVLILFAAFCFGAAIWREFHSVPPGKAHLSMMPRYAIVPVNVFLVLVTLAALVGNWLK